MERSRSVPFSSTNSSGCSAEVLTLSGCISSGPKRRLKAIWRSGLRSWSRNSSRPCWYHSSRSCCCRASSMGARRSKPWTSTPMCCSGVTLRVMVGLLWWAGSFQHPRVPADFPPRHGLPEKGKAVGIAALARRSSHLFGQRPAATQGLHPPGQATAPLQGDGAQVGLAQVAADYQHSVIGQQGPLVLAQSLHHVAATVGLLDGALVFVHQHRVAVHQGGGLVVGRRNASTGRPHRGPLGMVVD